MKEFINQLKNVINNFELVDVLRFKCVGHLCEEKQGYEDYYERLWLWKNEEGIEVVTIDLGNQCCTVLWIVIN